MLTRAMQQVRGAVLVFACLVVQPVWADYSHNPKAQAFINKMVSEHHFDKKALIKIFTSAEKKQSILDAMSRPAEKTKTWAQYRGIFIKKSRINGGVKFWTANAKALARAEKVYGVPAEYIVAIIGVETLYGKLTGHYRVIDALSTLAFDYPSRSAFFSKELKHYLLLTREHNRDPLVYKGSYAGAMGYGQFMPSSYRHYAVDFDGDNLPDIWNNPTDAIGSVANYFKRNGWQRGGRVAVRARPDDNFHAQALNDLSRPDVPVKVWQKRGLTPVSAVPADTDALAIELDGQMGNEYWLGFTNFYVITRYNRSRMYAMAVYQLAQAILTAKQAKDSE